MELPCLEKGLLRCNLGGWPGSRGGYCVRGTGMRYRNGRAQPKSKQDRTKRTENRKRQDWTRLDKRVTMILPEVRQAPQRLYMLNQTT